MELVDIEKFTKHIIPMLETELSNCTDNNRLLELINIYKESLRQIAPYDFISYNKYIEFHEDWNSDQKCFYGHRRNALGELFEAMNDMEIYDKYDVLIITMPPRVGKSMAGIRFLSWIIGRWPEYTQLATSYSDAITMSFYNGVMEIIQSDEYKEMFPESPLVNQNAKREEIWLRKTKRYPTIMFVPIDGSMTGRGEANNYLYCDDLVSGIEEALNKGRLDKLWEKYTINAKQRKKDGCKEIHIATPWSVHDVITKVKNANSENVRCKILKMSCYNEKEESNFDYLGGFTTQYYKEIERTMDKLTFNALYKQEPVERDGLLYTEDSLNWYDELPKDELPDTVLAICDSKNLGSDSVSCPIGYVYDDKVYIEDVMFDNGLPNVTKPMVADKLIRHNVKDFSIELNNGGNYFGDDVKKMVSDKLPDMKFSMFFSTSNKDVRIITYSDFVKNHFVFKKNYKPNSQYGKFMTEMLSYTQLGKNVHDDAVDSLSMMAAKIDNMKTNKITILNRKDLGI